MEGQEELDEPKMASVMTTAIHSTLNNLMAPQSYPSFFPVDPRARHPGWLALQTHSNKMSSSKNKGFLLNIKEY